MSPNLRSAGHFGPHKWRPDLAQQFDGFCDAAGLSGLKQVSRRRAGGARITDLAMNVNNSLCAIPRR